MFVFSCLLDFLCRMTVRCFLAVGVVWMLLGSVCAVAQSTVRLQASVTPSEPGVHETLVYTLRVEGVPRTAIETPSPPATTNLVLQSTTPNTRTGRVPEDADIHVVTFQWRYRPMRVGTARLRPTTVTIDGEAYTTAPIQATIVSQSQRPSTAPSQPPIAPPSASSANESSSLTDRDLFIEVEPSTTTVYHNEALIVAYRLFFRPGLQLRHSRLAEAWEARGFWREELEVSERPRPRTEVRDGTEYRSIVLKRAALFPTRPGRLTIEPMRIQTEASVAGLRASRDGFEPVTLTSDSLAIMVQPLPEAAPAGFAGVVGQFEMTTRLSDDSTAVGEAVDFRITIRGTGNLAPLTAPDLSLDAFDVYEPNTDFDLARDRAAIQGSKTFTYTLVAATPGQHRIPSLSFAYFDPATTAYRTLTTPPRMVHVHDAPSSAPAPPPASDAAASSSPNASSRIGTPRPPWMWMSGVLLLLLTGGAVWFYMQRRRTERTADIPTHHDTTPATTVAAVSPSPAMTEAQHDLNQAHRYLREHDVKPFYRALERAVLSFVGLRLQRPVKGLTRPVLDDVLDAYDVPRPTREALRELLDASDQAQFTPSQPSHDSMEAALNQAQEVILHLDATLPRPASADASSPRP